VTEHEEEHEHERRIRVDVYHHFDAPIEVKMINAAGEAVSFHLAPRPPTTNA
jgi:hypothetical protein